MSDLNLEITSYSARLNRNMEDIPNSIRKHLLANESILKPKQKEAVAKAMEKIVNQGKRAVAMVMPTATGKMVIIARMLSGIYADAGAHNQRKKVLFVCDGIEGIKQARDKMQRFAQIDAGAYYQYKKDWTQQVTVTTFHSWQSGSFPVDPESIDLVILDEAHMAITEARLSTLRLFKHAIWIAVTASPYYSDEQDVLRHFELGYQLNMRDAVQNRLICGFRNILLRSDITIDLDSFQSEYDTEYNEKMLATALNTEARNRVGSEFILFANHIDTGKSIREHRGIISCVDIAHANDVADQLNALYESYYPGQAPECGFVRSINGFSKDRNQLLQWHREGKIQYLSFADLLIHNYDDPGISVCLNLRLSKSIVLSTQRGGRTTRLDSNNPGKIALIVDMLDTYNGKAPDWPLFYAAAIGEIAVIPEEVMAMARESMMVLQRGTEGGRLGSVPIELRQMAKNAEFRIITDYEVILSIIRESTKEKVRWKTDQDLALSDVYKLSGLNKNRASAALTKLKTDWEKYKAEPNRMSKPSVDIYFVRQKGKGVVAAIPHSQWELFADQYLKGKNCPFQTESDLGPQELRTMTGLGESTIRKILLDLQVEQEEIELKKEPGRKTGLQVTLVRRKGTSPFLSIKRDDFTQFVTDNLEGRIFPKKSSDQITAKDLAQLTGRSERSAQVILAKIWKQWLAYYKDKSAVNKPIITVTKVRDNCSQPTYAVLKEDIQHFINIYQNGRVIQEKTDQDLIVHDLRALTGYSRNRIHEALLRLDKRWAIFNDTNCKEDKPDIPVYIVIWNKKHYKAISQSNFQTFVDKYLNGKIVRPITEDDITAEEIADKVGLRPLTIKALLRSLLAAQQSQLHHESATQSKVQINVVVNRSKDHIPTIRRADLQGFAEIHLKGKVANRLTRSDLTAEQLSVLTGYGVSYIKRCLASLFSDWQRHFNDPGSISKPLVPLNMVYDFGKARSRQQRSIPEEYIEIFKLAYLKKGVVPVKSANDLTVSDVCALTGLAKQTVFVAFRRVSVQNKQCQGNNGQIPYFFIQLYDVKVTGGTVVQAIHARDFRKFMAQNFGYMVDKNAPGYTSDNESDTTDKLTNFLRLRQDSNKYFSLMEIIDISGISKYILMQYIRPLEAAWKKYHQSPNSIERPAIRLLEVVGQNQHKTFAIPQSELFEFLSRYIPKDRFKKKSLERIYKEINVYSSKEMSQMH